MLQILITQLKLDKQDEIIGTLLTANLSEEETASALAQLTSEGSQMIYIKRDDPEDDVLIEYDGAGNKFLASVARRFEQDVKSLAAQNNNDLVNQIFPTIAGMDRSARLARTTLDGVADFISLTLEVVVSGDVHCLGGQESVLESPRGALLHNVMCSQIYMYAVLQSAAPRWNLRTLAVSRLQQQ